MVAVVLFATGLLLIGVIVAVRGLPPSFETVLSLGVGSCWGGFAGFALGSLLDKLHIGTGGFFSLGNVILYFPLGLLGGAPLGVIGQWLLAQSDASTRKAVLVAIFSVPLLVMVATALI